MDPRRAQGERARAQPANLHEPAAIHGGQGILRQRVACIGGTGIQFSTALVHAQPRWPSPTRRPSPRQRGAHSRIRYDETFASRSTLLGGFARDETKEIVVPQQKDLKRLIRSRMQKTGEAYTAARLQILGTLQRKQQNEPDYAVLAGMSDAAVRTK